MIESARLLLRPWVADDAAAALGIYGDDEVASWLTPVLPRIPDEAAMRAVLVEWRERSAAAVDPVGDWAVVRRADGVLVGGLAVRELETDDGDLELAWQLARSAWGHGYAAEGARALAGWAFARTYVDELLALVRPHNRRSRATAERIGMEWVGETEKFHGLRLLVFRLRASDLERPTVVEGDEEAPPLVPSHDRQA